MKRRFFSVALILLLIIIMNVTLLKASSIDQLKQQQGNMQAQLDEMENQEVQLEQSINEKINELNIIQDNIVALEGDINDLEIQISDKEKEISKTQDEIVIAKDKEQGQYVSLKSRIKYMYENSRLSYFQILFESDSITDFYKRYEYIKAMMNYDKEMFEQLEQTRIEIENLEASLQSDLRDLEAINQEFTLQLEELDNSRKLRQAAVQELKEQKLKLEDAKESLEQEMKEIAEIIKRKELEAKYEGGPLNWPVSGYYSLSSPFGWRKDPFTGEDWFHYGIDIPAPTGTDVTSAASGTVIFSGWKRGYGNTVIVSHGDGIVTLYAHNSRLVVSDGETVSRGQKIAEIGSTGRSTGPHSHFEVRVNGEFKNPMEYLGK